MDQTAIRYTTIDEYIAQFPADFQPVLEALRQAIREGAPEAVEKISWQMPTFADHGNVAHFFVHKRHIGFYPGSEAIEHFASELDGFKTSKGAVQLPLGQELPLALIRRMAAFSAGRNRLEAERRAANKGR